MRVVDKGPVDPTDTFSTLTLGQTWVPWGISDHVSDAPADCPAATVNCTSPAVVVERVTGVFDAVSPLQVVEPLSAQVAPELWKMSVPVTVPAEPVPRAKVPWS